MQLSDLDAKKIVTISCEVGLEVAMDQALEYWARPTTVVSTPFTPLPDQLFELKDPLTPEAFRDVIENNLTHHFRVARKASL